MFNRNSSAVRLHQSRIRAAVERVEDRVMLAASPVLVGDINQSTNQLGAYSAVQVGNVAYFAGRANAADGPELFKTDGTTAGTVLVKDINPSIGSVPTLLTNVNGILYFVANDGVTGRELWVSFGTADRTLPVTDIAPGAASSNPNALTVAGNKLFFLADDGTGETLWRSDTSGNVTKIVSSTGGTLSRVQDLTAYGSTLIFTALNSSGRPVLYACDASTSVAVPIANSPIGPSGLISFGGVVYFHTISSSSSTANGDIWKTDGTAGGTVLVKAMDFVTSGSDWASLGGFNLSGDRLYFVAGNLLDGNYNLWVSDGTAGGTMPLTTDNAFLPDDLFTPVGARSVLFQHTSTSAGKELWVSDGTVGGTKLLKDIAPGTPSGLAVYGGTVQLGGGRDLFVTSPVAGAPTQVWVTDGTVGGTTQVATINAAPVVTEAIGTFNGVALLSLLRDSYSGELFRSDGTAAGTYRLGATLAGNGSSVFGSSGMSSPFYSIGDTTYFAADDGVTGLELWKVVGQGTPTRITDIAPGGADATPADFAGNAGILYFTAGPSAYSVHDSLYYYIPGSSSAQLAVKRPGGGAVISDLHVFSTSAFFTVRNGSLSRPQLWKYDYATRQAAPVQSGGQIVTSPTQWGPFGTNGTFYFFGMPANSSTPTLYLMSAAPDAVPIALGGVTGTTGMPQPLGAIASKSFFLATTLSTGTELWTLDNSNLVSEPLANLTAGTGSTSVDTSLADSSITANGLFYFSASVNGGRYAAWQSDGTAAGTVPLTNAGTDPRHFVSLNGRVYFIANDSNDTSALYRIEATGAIKLKPATGPASTFSPHGLVTAGGKFFASGLNTLTAQYELWAIDAQTSAFTPITTLGPSNLSNGTNGALYSPVVFGGTALGSSATDLYFPMYTPQLGVEPYRLSLATTGNISGVVFDDANADGIRQSGEGPLAGETVYLDLNGNALFDSTEPSAVTTTAGYTFANLSTGNYSVRLKAPTGGRRSTLPNAVATVTISEGATVAATPDFGVTSSRPVAVIGGPGTVVEGSAITLDASASSEAFGTIAGYEWDFNYNGTTFDVDASGATPVFDAGQIDGPASRTVALRVTDANGLSSLVATRTISITNAAPTGEFSGTGVGEAGQALAFGWRNVTDPSLSDRTKLTLGYDYNNDGDFTDAGEANDSRPSSGYLFTTPGTFTVHGRVTDNDGAFSDYYTTVAIYPPKPAAQPAATLEGEAGTFAGGTAKGSSNAGYTGTGYADFGGQNSSAQWSLTRTAAGTATVTFRYANGGTANRPLSIVVNGTAVGSVACAPTGSWTTWGTVSIDVNLAAGANTIKAVATATVGGGNVDNLTITPPPVTPPAWLAPGDAVWWLTNNTLVIQSGNATLLADAGLTNPGLSIILAGGTLTSNTSQHLATLGIASGRFNMPPGGGHVLRVTALAGFGMDLKGNDLILDYSGTSPVDEVVRWLRNGSLTTTAARPRTAAASIGPARVLGYTTGTHYLASGRSTFDGETIDATSFLIKSTFAGDATLDGRVDFNDFLKLQNNFGKTAALFGDGDFTGDGLVNFNDFLLLQNNFGAA